MSDDLTDSPDSECAVCYAAHDDEIHQATLSVHRWFHDQVTQGFTENVYYAEAV